MISLDITSDAGGIRFSMNQKYKSHPGPFKRTIPMPLPYFLPRQVVVLFIRCEL
jgi:hypothetical protein